MELVELHEQREAFEAQGIRVVATSVDPPEELTTMRDASGATFPFLSDPEGVLMDAFDVRHSGGRMDGIDIAQSASFLLDAEGVVRWHRIAENYRLRPHPEEILAEIANLP